MSVLFPLGLACASHGWHGRHALVCGPHAVITWGWWRVLPNWVMVVGICLEDGVQGPLAFVKYLDPKYGGS